MKSYYHDENWGGKRKGSGRPRSELPTKTFRANELEIELIKILRSKSEDIDFNIVLKHAKDAENNMAYF